MKEKLFLIALIFLITSVSSLDINLEKQTFSQGETFLASLQGNFLQPIEKQDIGFFKKHLEQPLDFNLIKLNNTYYIYAILPYLEENYSLRIKNVYFKENNKPQIINLEKNFSISSNVADFYVKPGAISTPNNFSILLYNNLNNNFQIDYTIENLSKSFTLPLQDFKTIQVSTDHISNYLVTNLTILTESGFSYILPVEIIKDFQNQSEIPDPEEPNQSQEIIPEKDQLSFLVSDKIISFNISRGESIFFPIILSNIGNKTSENITISLTREIEQYVFLSPKKIDSLSANSSSMINLTFNFLEKGEFKGVLFAESLNSSDEILFEFYVDENISFSTSSPPKKSCVDLGYKKCAVCYGTTTNSFIASDAPCCIGSCEPPENPNRNWTFMIIMGVIILALGAIIYLKKRKPTSSAKDILEKRNKSFSDRFETKGNLSKF
jgi:hypothetical protein